jgi:hypothetical protein
MVIINASNARQIHGEGFKNGKFNFFLKGFAKEIK